MAHVDTVEKCAEQGAEIEVPEGNNKILRARVKKRGCRSRTFTMTYWIPGGEDHDEKFLTWVRENCDKALLNPEKCPKTDRKHYQCCLYFKNPRDVAHMRETWAGHWIDVARRPAKLEEYASKGETRYSPLITVGYKTVEDDELEGRELYPWQQEIFDEVLKSSTARKIIWRWEKTGNVGKSALVRHMLIKFPGNICQIGGNANDMQYAVKAFTEKKNTDLRMLILDIPRAKQDKEISYEGLESLKDGKYFSAKFKSGGEVLYRKPHIVVFSNRPPDYEKMSADRWDVEEIVDDISEFL